MCFLDSIRRGRKLGTCLSQMRYIGQKVLSRWLGIRSMIWMIRRSVNVRQRRTSASFLTNMYRSSSLSATLRNLSVQPRCRGAVFLALRIVSSPQRAFIVAASATLSSLMDSA
ncbi:unnamed protein product [Laminaria digitata]